MKRIQYILLTLILGVFLLGNNSALKAQDFPVESTVQLLPPHPLKLSDYMDESGNGIIATIVLKEAGRIQFPVRLRITIEGQEVRVVTRQTYIPPPIFLDGNVPAILTGADLAGYFNLRNLEVSGSAANSVTRGQPFPEGVYQFRIEVLDYNRGNVISNAGATMAWLVANDPPLLNLPANNSVLERTIPQNILFQWTPRHTASPNAAFNVIYRFEMVEIRPAGRNPNDAILTSNKIYETDVFGNNLIYGPGEPQLIAGMEYAWRVKAIDESGKDLFSNQGYTEVFKFTYGEACQEPDNLKVSTFNHNSATISWNTTVEQDNYEIQIRKADEVNGKWHTYTSQTGSVEVPWLEANQTYEYRGSAYCLGIKSDETEKQEFTTQEVPPSTCGDDDVEYVPLNNEPVETLRYGDIISASNFDVYVTAAEKSGTTFTGTGLMTLPFLNAIRVPAEFENIGVNTDYELIDGVIVTTHSPVENVLNLDSAFNNNDGADSYVDDVTDATGADTVITINDEIDSVYVTDNGDIIVVTTDEEEIDIGNVDDITDTSEDGQEVLAIVDEDGNTYTVDGDGNVVPVGDIDSGGEQQPYNPSGDENRFDFIVQFEEDPNQLNGGFDKKDYTVHNHYDTTTIKETLIDIPWKSVVTGRTAYVKASYEDENSSNVIFKSSYGSRPAQGTTVDGVTEQRILIQGRSDGTTEEMYAVGVDTVGGSYYEENLGRLNIITYDQKDIDITLVNVNGDNTSLPNLQRQLNDILGQAGVHVSSVTTISDLSVEDWDKDGDEKFDDGDGNMFSSRSPEMNNIKNTLRRTSGIDKHTYYIFFVPHPTKSGTGRVGSMPRGTQFGFIYTANAQGSDITKVIAHELGHGVFGLKHTFSDYPSISRNSSDNLMDYKQDGRKLRKYQWDQMHDPGVIIGLFDDEEDVAYVSANAILDVAGDGVSVSNSRSFVTPAGQVYTVPEGTTRLSFTSSTKKAPFGSLTGYWVGSSYYVGVYSGANFKGYALIENISTRALKKNANGSIQYESESETAALSPGSPVILGYPHDGNTYFTSVEYQSLPSAGISNYGNGVLKRNIGLWSLGAGKNLTSATDNSAANVYGYPRSISFDAESTLQIECNGELEADLLAIYQNHPWMQDDSPFKPLIVANPCLLLGTYKYGEGLGYETEFMKNLKATVGGALAIGMLPAAIGIMGPVIIEQYGAQKAREVAIAMTVDMGMQVAISTAFEGKSFDDAIADADFYSVMTSGFEALYDNTYVTVGAGCLLDGLTDDGTLDSDVTLEKFTAECAEGAFTNLLMEKVFKASGKVFKRLLNIAKTKPARFGFGLAKLGITDQARMRSVCEYLGLDEATINKVLPACFAAGTMVTTCDDQLTPIESLIIGDQVLSYDFRNEMVVPSKIIDVFSREVEKLTVVYTSLDTIYTTEDHPFYVEGDWIAAKKLNIEDRLLTKNGTTIQVQRIESLDSTILVYNFEVERYNNYFVHSSSILVHNECKPLSEDLLKVLDGLDPDLQLKVANLGDAAEDFLKDLTGNPGIKEYVDAWDFVRRATGSNSSKRLSEDILESVNKHMGDTEFMRIVGNGKIGDGENAFGELISKYAGKCKACDSGNPSNYLPDNPKDYIDKVVELTKRYSDKNGIDIFKEAKKAYSSQEGAWHAMQHLDKLNPKNVKQIDAKFEGDGLPCDDCRFDVELIPTVSAPLKLIEYKSYLDASKIPLKQFKNYLNDVTNINQFNYIFSEAKLDLDDAKEGMKNFLISKADDLFKAPEQGGVGVDKMKQLFQSAGVTFNNPMQFKAALNNNSNFRKYATSFVDVN